MESVVKFAKFSLAKTESYKDKEGNLHSETEWLSIVAWRSLAELAGKYLSKGSHIYLECKIKTRSYEDKDEKIYYRNYCGQFYQAR